MVAQISALPPSPIRGEDPADFNDKADALVGALPGFVTQANTLATEVNSKAAAASSAASTATTKAAEAAAWAATAVASAPAYDSGSTYDFPNLVAFLIDGQTYRAMGPVAVGEAPSIAPAKWVKVTHSGVPDDQSVSSPKMSPGGPAWTVDGDLTAVRDVLATRDIHAGGDQEFGGDAARTVHVVFKSGSELQYNRSTDAFSLIIGGNVVFNVTSSGEMTGKDGQRVGMFYPSGSALPTSDIGVIWHADYNSWMTWQIFSANGASYTGYASVNVGRMIPDSQPTPRTGSIKVGSMNVSKTAQVRLWNWALHNNVVVPVINWTVGMNAYADNGDGTFRTPDLRAYWSRIWDDSSGRDSGRSFTSGQLDAIQNITGSFNGIMGGGLAASGAFSVPLTYNNQISSATIGGQPSGVTFDASRVARTATETRVVNFNQLGSIQC